MAAQGGMPQTNVELLATDAAGAVAAAAAGQERVDQQLSQLHKIAAVLEDRQTGQGDALLDAAAAAALAAKPHQRPRVLPALSVLPVDSGLPQSPWRRPLAGAESPVQVVVLLGIEGSRHEMVRDWLLSAAVASGRRLVGENAVWAAIEHKRAAALRDRLSNVTTRALQSDPKRAPPASVLVLASPWPARLVQRELPADCGPDVRTRRLAL
jgi:hypothetical protein